MKRTLSLGGCFILLFGFVLVCSGSAESISVTLKTGSYKITQEKDGYEFIKMEAFTTATVPGRPVLPHRIYNIAVPPDIEWESLELVLSTVEEEKLAGIHKIRICPPDMAWNGSRWLTSSEKPEDLQAGVPVRIIAISQLRKWKFVKVEFAPFVYNSETDELELTKKADIVISYRKSGDRPSPSALQDSVMDEVAKDIFMNYSQAAAWYAPESSKEAPSAISDYVIITTEAIKTNSTKLNSFIAHKQSMGFTVAVITETTWGATTGQAPNHKAEKIREWLKSNYVSRGIKYVLLIGNPSPYESGEGDVPMKKCWPLLGSGSDEDSPTDYFFADLTGNWDNDGDGYYGEYSQDQGTGGVDFTPEVYVGRIPVYSGAYSTLDGILQKIINFETEAGTRAWRKSTLLPMSFSASAYDGAPLAEQMKDDYLSSEGYTCWRQYQQGSAYASDDSAYASEEELRGGYVVTNRWAGNDYGIVCWWGHGSSTSTAVGYDGHWDGNLFYYTYCSSLDDAHPSFTYQCSCTNAYPEDTNNLAYSILKQGGVETVSASRVSWFNTGVGYGSFDGSTTNSGIGYEYVKRLAVNELAAGDALYLAKSSMTPESGTRLMNYYDFNLYGDPAVSLVNVISPASIFVTSPNGGEQWTVGSSQTIRWTTAGSCPMVKVELSTNNGSSWSTISAERANTGTCPWTVPGTISSQCRIRVGDSTDSVPVDMSNTAFSIVAVQSSTVTVTKPNGGESWVAGSAHDITWSSTGTVANVKIEYSTNGGASFTSITASTANDGAHPWNLPSSVSSNCLVKITNAANAAVNDMSNGTFSVVSMAGKRLTWTSGYSGAPAIAVDASGRLHAVWQDNTPGNYEIYYRKSTNGGVSWTTSKRLTWTSGYSGAPAIAVDASGNPHVVWHDNTSGNYEIYHKKSTTGGVSWTTAKRFTTTSGPSQNPDIAVDASGNPHVVWQDNTPGNEEIYYRKSPDGGTTWAANKRLTWTSGGSGLPAVGAGPSGRIHVTWRDYTAGSYEIYYKKSTNGGANWTANQRLTWNSGASDAPAIGVSSAGNPHVVWRDNTSGNYEVYYRKSTDGGATWAVNQRLTWTSGASYAPDIAVGPSSHLSVVWADSTPGNSEVYLKRSANWGGSWAANKRLTWNSGGSEAPAVSVDSSGNLHIVWQDNTPGNYEIYYLKF